MNTTRIYVPVLVAAVLAACCGTAALAAPCVLPEHPTASSTEPAFWVTQLGTGSAGKFEISNAANSVSALLGMTSGTGRGIYGSSAGGVGVYGTSTAAIGVYGTSSSNTAGKFEITSATSGSSALIGTTSGTGRGVYGLTLLGSQGVYGESRKTDGVGVYGLADTGAAAAGVYGASNAGRGVVGLSYAGDAGVRGVCNKTNGAGVWGTANYGTVARAIYGSSTGGFAGYFEGKVLVTGNLTPGSITLPTDSVGSTNIRNGEVKIEDLANGAVTNAKIGLRAVKAANIAPDGSTSGQVLKSTGTGVGWAADGLALPYAGAANTEDPAFSITNALGVAIHVEDGGGTFVDIGDADEGEGLHADATAVTDGTGIHGICNNGTMAFGVRGESSTGYAGWFDGSTNVVGTFSACDKQFKIDHPLDPANKYLRHSSVESAEMKTFYDGTVILDANGEAAVQLPDWFEALNKDFRYQLTAIGAPAPNLYIAQEISAGAFRIAGGPAGIKVSWLVTGVRKDAWAAAHPLVVEESKAGVEQGRYMNPELFGEPKEMSVTAAKRGSAPPASN